MALSAASLRPSRSESVADPSHTVSRSSADLSVQVASPMSRSSTWAGTVSVAYIFSAIAIVPLFSRISGIPIRDVLIPKPSDLRALKIGRSLGRFGVTRWRRR